MSNHDEKDLLTQALRDRSTDVGGHPIDLADVRTRARHIRRRRNAVRGAVAAMIAAVAVPSGIAVNTALDTPGSLKSDRIATSPSPRTDGPVGLRLDGLPTGEAPQVPYFTTDPANPEDARMVTPDGLVHFDPELGPVQAAAPFGDGWVVLAYAGNGGPEIFRLDADGRITGKEQQPAGPTMYVAKDGSRVAYTLLEEDGTQLLYDVSTTDMEARSWRLPAKPEITPVGFVDDDTIAYEAGANWVEAEVYTVDVGGTPQRVPGLMSASDAGHGLVVGTSRIEADESVCAAAVAADSGEQLWENCDYSLPGGALSPTGQWLQALDSYTDGYGPLSMAVLDTATGDPVVEYGQAGNRGQVTLMQRVWESEDTLLSATADPADEQFTILRLDVNGTAEHTIDPVDGAAYGDLPFWFNAAP